MKRHFAAIALLLFAGCAESHEPEALGVPTDVPEDSRAFHETYALSPTGIGRSWSFTVAEPGGTQGLLRFSIAGLFGSPVHADQLCFSYSYEQRLGNTTRTDEGSRGSCGGPGNLVVAPEVDPDGETLFSLEGPDLLPGKYAFHAEGPSRPASLVVDFEPR